MRSADFTHWQTQNNVPLQVVVPREPAPIRRHSPVQEKYEPWKERELDNGTLTGKQLYEKILAEEIGQRLVWETATMSRHRSLSSSSGAPPPDPQSDQEVPPDIPTPTPRSTLHPPTYEDYKDSQKYSLG